MTVVPARTDHHVDVDGKRVAIDSEGYLLDRSRWSPEFARALAKREGLELTPAHWEVIDYLRDYEARHGVQALLAHRRPAPACWSAQGWPLA